MNHVPAHREAPAISLAHWVISLLIRLDMAEARGRSAADAARPAQMPMVRTRSPAVVLMQDLTTLPDADACVE